MQQKLWKLAGKGSSNLYTSAIAGMHYYILWLALDYAIHVAIAKHLLSSPLWECMALSSCTLLLQKRFCTCNEFH
jgi:hypothetical protein